jgi:ribosome-binding protein aMBF1 (putative translation factor)
MYCKICGSENSSVRVYISKGRQCMCIDCAKDTPRKASPENFHRAYFGSKWQEVPHGIRKEFYSDYLTSTHTVDQYIEATTTQE